MPIDISLLNKNDTVKKKTSCSCVLTDCVFNDHLYCTTFPHFTFMNIMQDEGKEGVKKPLMMCHSYSGKG